MKVYKDGKYWQNIAKANPNVQSSELHQGMKLIIPPLPDASAAADTPASSTAAGNTSPKEGERVYVVTSEDKGLWDIAAKAYGNGSHWQAIAKANPAIRSSALRAGQKLIIPKLEGAASSASVSAPRKAARNTPPAAHVSAGSSASKFD